MSILKRGYTKDFKTSVSLINKSIKNCFDMELYPVQVQAISLMDRGYITNIETGEGKTLIIASLALVKALKGQKVVVITPNEYLNFRDYETCSTIAKSLGITCSYNDVDTEKGLDFKSKVYSADIVYSTCSEFIFDYLRNKDSLESISDLLNMSIIIDEIDQVLVDNSNTDFSVSMDSVEISENEHSMYVLVKELCKLFIGGEVESHLENEEIDSDSGEFDFIFNKIEGFLFLTARGLVKLNNILAINLEEGENLPLLSAIHNTLRATHMLVKGRDYAVRDGAISIIDKNNGRLKKNNQYSSGINLALEIKEGCEISHIPDDERSINGLFFFSQFEDLVGCSGTAYECRNIFQTILKRDVKSIPRNKKINMEWESPIFYKTKEEKYKAVEDLIENIQLEGLPLLVVAEDDNVCLEFFSRIRNKYKSVKILTNDNLEEEEAIVKDSGLHASILVSTLISGRGTDIHVEERLSELGGLQIIFLSRFENRRAEKQVIGRTGRQGKRGKVRVFASIGDKVFNHLPIRKQEQLCKYVKNGQMNRIEKVMRELQRKYLVKCDSNIIHLYKKNYILNMFENYLEGKTSYTQDYLYEIENFVIGQPIGSNRDFNQCVIDTKRFIDTLMKGEPNE